eukprot:gene3995-4996_t
MDHRKLQVFIGITLFLILFKGIDSNTNYQSVVTDDDGVSKHNGIVVFDIKKVDDNDFSDSIITEDYGITTYNTVIKYYFVRHDVRKCSRPRCGGFFLKPLNMDHSKEIYVSRIMPERREDDSLFKKYTLNGKLIQNIIIRGNITKNKNDDFQPQEFKMTHLYVGMTVPPEIEDHQPIWRARKSKSLIFESAENQNDPHSFYILSSPLLKCNSIEPENCPLIHARRLNTEIISSFKGYKQPYTDRVRLLDSKWFLNRLISSYESVDGKIGEDFDKIGENVAIVQGQASDGDLKISKVFIRIPDPLKKVECPKLDQFHKKCDSSLKLIPVYYRDDNRCIQFDACVVEKKCMEAVSDCQTGYKLFKVPATGPNSCPKYFCDPDFL